MRDRLGKNRGNFKKGMESVLEGVRDIIAGRIKGKKPLTDLEHDIKCLIDNHTSNEDYVTTRFEEEAANITENLKIQLAGFLNLDPSILLFNLQEISHCYSDN